ncbi:MAG: NRDE family protein [Proteobacteria bacterium]|nr:NRDE family protein [Desulfobacula sp.]MBU3953370.1 NRDE family protein [Pseudomonadota bacterium]MBU4131977.1 NRDE family protein [Pseudomonadota bacterium]
MCLVLFGVNVSESFPFILAANRDEFYQRPTAAMNFWQENPAILAGKDLEHGGTWFGLHTRGRFAALTNYRDLSMVKPSAPSRGDIIPKFLESNSSIPDFLEQLKTKSSHYNGFNLLAGDSHTLYWFSNQNQKITRVTPGIHGLSNHLMDTPWPKVTAGKTALARAMDANTLDPATLFDLLSDTSRPADASLPDTGVGADWERILSPLFIQSPSYGTRSSIVMGITPQGQIQVTERTHFPDRTTPYTDRNFSLFPR